MSTTRGPAGWRRGLGRTAEPKTVRKVEEWGAAGVDGRRASDTLDLDELAERAELRASAWRRARGI